MFSPTFFLQISVVETELQSKSGDGNRSQEGFVGFPDRVNVGVSRALDHLCLIGNSSSLLQVRVGLSHLLIISQYNVGLRDRLIVNEGGLLPIPYRKL